MKRGICLLLLLSSFLGSSAIEQHGNINREGQNKRAVEDEGGTTTPIVNGMNQVDPPPSLGRLPSTIRPFHYNLHLQPFLTSNFSIHGSLEVQLEVLETTNKVVVNMADIITRNETVKVVCEGVAFLIANQTYDPKYQLYTAHLGQNLTPNTTCTLAMKYVGYLNDKLVGFYRSVYIDGQGISRVVAGTQFSPTDARRAFPCWDEPGFKAVFDIHLARPTNMTAFSNMPLLSTTTIEGEPGWVWDTFNTTVPMSTYLVGFLICDYSFLATDNKTHNDSIFKVWTRAEALNQTTYVSSIAPTLLSYLEDYFQVPFPLPKLDMATMADFKFGAMENWGLILCRETKLLYDPIKSSASSKQSLANILAHEIAHQWFGNLVTPAWWSDLWLKEGFATFMGYVALNHTEPTWGNLDSFLKDNLQVVLVQDSLKSTHPVRNTVNHPDEISQMFDAISYKKGASIIRMMQNFLTEATFRKGLTSYINEFKYKNAEQDDLWRHLTQAAQEDGREIGEVGIKAVMDLWTLQKGYPVITILRNGTTATLTQDWFLLDGSISGGDNTGEQPGWWVPISYTTQQQPDFTQTHPQNWMTPDRTPLHIAGLPSKNQWVVVNVQETGYYRVNYDHNTWRLLTHQLHTHHVDIHPANRAQIINDACNLARAGLLDYSTALNITKFLGKEDNFVVWSAALSSLSHLMSMLSRSAAYGPLREYVRHLVVPLYDSVGLIDHPDDPHVTRYKRALAVNNACRLNHEPCLTQAKHLLRTWLNNPHNDSVMSGNIAYTVLRSGVAAGGEEVWQQVWHRYTTSNVPSEKDDILTSLGATKEIWLLAKYISMAFSPGSGVRKQDTRKVFSAVANNPVGRDLAWNFLQDRWGYIVDYLGSTSSHLSSIVGAATSTFNTNLELQELERFKENNIDRLGSASRAVDQALESTRLNVKWMERNYGSIVEWLDGPENVIMP